MSNRPFLPTIHPFQTLLYQSIGAVSCSDLTEYSMDDLVWRARKSRCQGVRRGCLLAHITNDLIESPKTLDWQPLGRLSSWKIEMDSSLLYNRSGLSLNPRHYRSESNSWIQTVQSLFLARRTSWYNSCKSWLTIRGMTWYDPLLSLGKYMMLWTVLASHTDTSGPSKTNFRSQQHSASPLQDDSRYTCPHGLIGERLKAFFFVY